MHQARFYCPVIKPGLIQLSDEEARHARNSLRMGPGDPLLIFDGRGHEGRGEVRSVDSRSVTVEIKETWFRDFEFSLRIALATAIPRGPRQDFLVEKCTELGVASLWPLKCERSVVIPKDHLVDRWQRTAREAAKQCGAAWVPEVASPQSFDEAIGRASQFDAAVITNPKASDVFSNSVLRDSTTHSLLAFIGPEGGWSETELSLSKSLGVLPLSLGPRILRIETACILLAAHACLGAQSFPSEPLQ